MSDPEGVTPEVEIGGKGGSRSSGEAAHADRTPGAPESVAHVPAGPIPLVPTPAEAGRVFGDRVGLAEQFVSILADTGISYGLIGPREAPRLWDRHVLNCAVTHLAIPEAGSTQRVIDVGSGAGLPGLAIAIARPDLEVHLVEPLMRRTGWLSGTVAQLELDNVVVHTARAEAMWGRLSAPVVTARAVSRIVQLAEWTLPLLEPHGSLLALKGESAAEELAASRTALMHLGVVDARVQRVGEGLLEVPTVLIRATIGTSLDLRRFRAKLPSSAGSARRRADRPRGSRRSGPSVGDRGRRGS